MPITNTNRTASMTFRTHAKRNLQPVCCVRTNILLHAQPGIGSALTRRAKVSHVRNDCFSVFIAPEATDLATVNANSSERDRR